MITAFIGASPKAGLKLMLQNIFLTSAVVEDSTRFGFPILAGIIAPDVEWVEGVSSSSFNTNLVVLTNERSIDYGLALSDRSFDRFDGELVFSDKECSLAFFLFRLLQKLQSLGTVPAIDWNKYASVLGKTTT
jgi:hypothetical protein